VRRLPACFASLPSGRPGRDRGALSTPPPAKRLKVRVGRRFASMDRSSPAGLVKSPRRALRRAPLMRLPRTGVHEAPATSRSSERRSPRGEDGRRPDREGKQEARSAARRDREGKQEARSAARRDREGKQEARSAARRDREGKQEARTAAGRTGKGSKRRGAPQGATGKGSKTEGTRRDPAPPIGRGKDGACPMSAPRRRRS